MTPLFAPGAAFHSQRKSKLSYVATVMMSRCPRVSLPSFSGTVSMPFSTFQRVSLAFSFL